MIVGEELWARLGEGQNATTAAGDVISKKRWDLWVEKFQFLSCRDDLELGTRELAAQAVAIMKRVNV